MGCDECKVEADVDGRRVLVTIRYENTDKLGIDPARWAILYRCRHCGGYWELEDRTFAERAPEYVRTKYPALALR